MRMVREMVPNCTSKDALYFRVSIHVFMYLRIHMSMHEYMQHAYVPRLALSLNGGRIKRCAAPADCFALRVRKRT